MQTLDLSAKEKRKSLLLTVLIYTLFLLILFFIRFWPPSNTNEALLAGGGGGGGVTINFGDSDFGAGKDFQSEQLDIKNVKNVASVADPQEDIISGDVAEKDAVVLPKNANPVKKITKPKVVIDPKPVSETKPKVSKNTNDALASILGGSKKGGDGDDSRSGNKGKTNGSLGSNDYYGSGGSGGGKGGGNGTGNGTGTGSGSGSGSGGGSGSGNGGGVGYSLGNRKALAKPQPNYTCNEEGRVVVEVTVDQTGKTISAVAGVKGTTNTASCLLQQAKLAAMNTKWQASADAPERQVGKIIYSFILN